MDPLLHNFKSIRIPRSDLPDAARFALDIGGSLAKLAYVSRDRSGDDASEVELLLVTFDTEKLDECLHYILHEVLPPHHLNHLSIRATGVGCMKYRDRIANTLNVQLRADSLEMEHAARGVDTLWRHLSPDKLLHEGSDVKGCAFQCALRDSGVLPCLLVNLGSALTIVQISEDGAASEIVGGSTQGGLTFLGLGVLLTRAKNFHELMEIAERGNRQNVDLLVKDTAGCDYNRAPSEGMVSSFGKAAKLMASDPDKTFKDEDIASSLLFCITDQLAQTTYLVAKAQGVRRAIFCGSYLAGSPTVIGHIQTKLTACSTYLKHQLSPIFLQYEAYLGAVGLLLGDSPVNGAVGVSQEASDTNIS